MIDRLQRNGDLLQRARVLWVDDHRRTENKLPVVELLRQFGASVDTPTSNADALRLLRANRYDVARDDEEPRSDLKGVELAEEVFKGWRLRTLLATARFNPATLPGRD